MEHVVFFPAQDGTPAFRRFAGLEDAVRFVEHLRNVENVSGASVHSLTEVPLSFKAWYRVELPATAEQDAVAADAPSDLAAPAAASADASPAEPERVPVPETIAAAIETYHGTGLGSVDLPEAGSATGIVVPEQPLVAIDQFGALPAPAVAFADRAESSQADAEQPGQAQVLEPAFGVRRERGIGFFAR